MAKFSIMDSATEGFRLIGKRPISMLVLVLLWIIIGYGPAIGLVLWSLPQIMELAQGMDGPHTDIDPALAHKMTAFFTGMAALFAPLILWLMVVHSIFNAAVFRAVLEPQKRGFAYLRLGGDELRQFLTGILIFLLLLALYLIFAVFCILVITAGKAVGRPWEGWIDTLGIIIGVCACIWVIVRFTLALPMTFAEKRISVFPSFRVTRGQFWPLIGMLLMIFVCLIGVAIVGGALRAILVLIAGGANGGFAHMASAMDDGAMFRDMKDHVHDGLPAMLKALGPVIAVSFAVQLIIQGVSRIISIAPFARAYAQLSGRDAPATTEH
jgi:hypothetical protein